MIMQKSVVYPQFFNVFEIKPTIIIPMNSDLYFDGKRYISSCRAAKISGYVNDYIGQLCRDDKLECRMVGRSWYVALDSLVQHKNLNGIGTRSKGPQKIAEDHAKPILGDLRESEKALFVPSVNFPTFAQNFDLPRTLSKSGQVNKNLGGQAKPEPGSATVNAPLRKKILEASYPFGMSPLSAVVSPHQFVSISKKRRGISSMMIPVARLSLASLAIIIAILGFRFGMTVNPMSHEIYTGAFKEVSKEMQASAFSSVGQTFDQVAIAWHDTLQRWLFNTRQTFYVLAGKSFAQNTVVPVAPAQTNSSPSQGMVVVPINPNTNKDAVVAKVKQSFSDEVSVSPNADGSSGVITPVFKKTKGDEYLYVMVPIKN